MTSSGTHRHSGLPHAITAYAIWGLKAGYEREHFNIYVEGRNLSDLNYIATTDIVAQAFPDSPLFWPGNGRAVYAGLQLKW